MNRSMAWLRRLEALLLAVGLSCAGYFGVVKVQAGIALHESKEMTQRVAAEPSGKEQLVQSTVPVDAEAGRGGAATVMGRLEIPQIGLAVPILSDYETKSLLRGIGHVPGTAMPGGLGTIGLAGHRDTYFRPLSRIKKDMDVRVSDETGVYHYEVDSTEIVKPDNVSVLDIKDRPGLTLITCYPFHYVGAAPFRFIVHAHLLSVLPDEK